MSLLKSQRVEVFDALAAGPMDFIAREPYPALSEFEYFDTDDGACVVHGRSEYGFWIIRPMLDFDDPNTFRVSFSPGRLAESESASGQWPEVMRLQIRFWLAYLSREINAGDPWGALTAQAELLAPPSVRDSRNLKFDRMEQEALGRHIDELGAFLRATANLSPRQELLVDSQIVYLKDASGRVGRDDFLQLVKAAFVTLIVEAAIPPDLVRQAVTSTLGSVAHLMGIHIPDILGPQ